MEVTNVSQFALCAAWFVGCLLCCMCACGLMLVLLLPSLMLSLPQLWMGLVVVIAAIKRAVFVAAGVVGQVVLSVLLLLS